MIKTRKGIYASIMILTMLLTLAGAGFAQSEIEQEPPEWYHETDRGFDMVVVTASAETLPIALINAVGKLYVDNPLYTNNFKTVESQSLGPIKFSRMVKDSTISNDSGEKQNKKTFVTNIDYSNSNGELTIKLFEEKVNNALRQHYEMIYHGITFSELIAEMKSLGIEIRQQSTLAKSYIRLLLPADLVPGDEELYTKFKKSKAFEELKEEQMDEELYRKFKESKAYKELKKKLEEMEDDGN